MGVIYVGNCEFEEIADFQLGKTAFGMDTITRSFAGRSDKLNAFLRKMSTGTSDVEYPGFKSRGVSVNRDGPFHRVTVEFIGLYNDVLPEVPPESGWRRQSSTFHQQGGTGVAEVEYAAPFTTYRYIAREKPVAQKFRGQLDLLGAAWEVYQIKGAKDVQFFEVQPLGRIGGVVSGAQTVTGKYNWVREVVTSIFTPKAAGNYWEVEEQNEGRMLPVDRTDLPRFLFPDRIAGGFNGQG